MVPGETSLLSHDPWVTPYRLTVADYHRMGEAGILTEDERVELIEGRLICLTPIDSPHAGTVNTLTRLLVTSVGDRGVVAVQNPVRLDDHSEPQPDFAVLRPRADDYMGNTPRPTDVLLLIEVANAGLTYDRRVKRALYARHGIPEFWIVDLVGRTIEVCRSPMGDAYASVQSLGPGATLEPSLLPGCTIPVAAILR